MTKSTQTSSEEKLNDSENSLKAGDIVRLRSGGPNMTITKVEGDLVECTWFKNEIPSTARFPLISLISIK